MKVEKLIGRGEEQKLLKNFLESNNAEFLAVYGRRRVGKTFLITKYFSDKDCTFFYITGIKNAKLKTQIKSFTRIISDIFYNGLDLTIKNNWQDTFDLLTKAIESQNANKKIVLFFDEFPWMVTKRSGLLEALDYYWNRFWANDQRVKLIICGSSASWIIEKIIANKGGLHNRITRKIYLETFNLKETKDFLSQKLVKLSNKQILQIYFVTGGVPYYLKNIEKGLSATQLIEKLAFEKKALLLDEFDNLFASLFDDHDSYQKLIKIIAKRKNGIGQEELLTEMGDTFKGAGGLKKLKNLERAGFIICFKSHFHQKRGIYYRLIDQYAAFYLDWILPMKETLLSKSLDQGYWDKIQLSPKWHNWMGYAFESVCYKHLLQIKNTLNLSATAIPNTWRFIPQKNSAETGTQIDLLFDRDDNVITICEIKCTEKPFEIDKVYAKNLQNKLEVFRNKTKTKKELFLAMISAEGLKPTMYSEELIAQTVILDDLFK